MLINRCFSSFKGCICSPIGWFKRSSTFLQAVYVCQNHRARGSVHAEDFSEARLRPVVEPWLDRPTRTWALLEWARALAASSSFARGTLDQGDDAGRPAAVEYRFLFRSEARRGLS